MPTLSTPLQAWIAILLAGLLEVLFSYTMKLSDGYTRWLPGITSACAAVLSVWVMSLSLKLLPLGTAYAVWAGFGAVGTALVGMLVFGETMTPLRLLCIAAVVGGIVGLQLQHG